MLSLPNGVVQDQKHDGPVSFSPTRPHRSISRFPWGRDLAMRPERLASFGEDRRRAEGCSVGAYKASHDWAIGPDSLVHQCASPTHEDATEFEAFYHRRLCQGPDREGVAPAAKPASWPSTLHRAILQLTRPQKTTTHCTQWVSATASDGKRPPPVSEEERPTKRAPSALSVLAVLPWA